MFGKRSSSAAASSNVVTLVTGPAASAAPAAVLAKAAVQAAAADGRRSDTYYTTKSEIFGALIEAIDLSQLSKLNPESARNEIRGIIVEIIAAKNLVLSMAEQEELTQDICNDVLGLGPLEPLLARDDIADIMVNGASKTYIEVGGKIQLTSIASATMRS